MMYLRQSTFHRGPLHLELSGFDYPFVLLAFGPQLLVSTLYPYRF